MRAGTRRRLRVCARVTAFGTCIGATYSLLLQLTVLGDPPAGLAIGAIHGFLLGTTIGPLEIFGTRTRFGRAVEQAPFLVTLAAKIVLYGSLIALVNIVEPGTRLLGLPVLGGPIQVVGVIFSFVATAAVIFVLQISQIIGGRTLRNWVLGRYHRPRQEVRFFLFVDLAGSTALAERLGPVGVHRFLDRIFVLASDPVDDQSGEIYQYVGDEMVVTWTAAEGRPAARPLACFFDIERALQAAAPGFQRDFGAVPRVRGALHAGPVIAGEVGGSKRDIVFHGDVLNTAARLEQLARERDQRLVVSADALEGCRGTERYALEDLGMLPLRGRAAPVAVYAVTERCNGNAGGTIRSTAALMLLLGLALGPAVPLRAQTPARPVVGYLSARSPEDTADLLTTFREALAGGGFVENRSVTIEYRWARGQYDRLPALAAELVHLPVSVLVAAGGETAALAAKAATTTIPIVFSVGSDPVKLGLVASFSHPGGNATGVDILTPTLEGKRLQLLHELVPQATTVAFLVNPGNPPLQRQLRDAEASARALGLRLQVMRARSDQDIDAVFARVARQRIGALAVAAAPFFDTRRALLVDAAARHAVPTIYHFREFADAGGLLSYGIDPVDTSRQIGVYVGRILKGARPADLPVQQPTKFELVINVKTAKTLGVAIPPTLRARADRLIE
ncbi:MAG TPA: ABC transporter substrate binding protein [Methylomirabilota bacterium]|nr:ABC transporter substrate binding protein [Methylomirabilota bacterium]